MVKPFLRQSPLAHLHLEARRPLGDGLPEAGIHVAERPHRSQIAVRGQATDPAFLQGIEKALGISLPTEACTASGKPGDLQVLWMGPDEWLVVGGPDNAALIISKLTTALVDLQVALVDVSESRTVIELSGKQARVVLDKGCSIDLHPRSFGPGQVVNTLLGRGHVLLHQTDHEPASGSSAYDIYVHRSYAEYLWSWIEDAAREYGLAMRS
ncbi:MAG: sarcosine oxidase subunit gamma [Rhodospirillales bacterium]|nr:sarcosine oxidase subunit gamma [Rhodospirillales bacterium]